MHSLLILGATILSLHGHHQPRYWWPAMDSCTIATAIRRDGSLRAVPYIQCVATAAHYSTKPAPPMVGPSVNSPQAQQSTSNYCPLKPHDWCTPPADPVNIGPDYQGN